MTWRFLSGSKEHHLWLECGIAVYLYREHQFPGEWLWRIAGARDVEPRRTFTDVVPDAKRIALRGADLLLRQAIDQVAAELVASGTGMGN